MFKEAEFKIGVFAYFPDLIKASIDILENYWYSYLRSKRVCFDFLELLYVFFIRISRSRAVLLRAKL